MISFPWIAPQIVHQIKVSGGQEVLLSGTEEFKTMKERVLIIQDRVMKYNNKIKEKQLYH